MRAILCAAVIGVVGAMPTYAQAQSRATMVVSVRVVRTCTITEGTTRITAPCAAKAEPRVELSAPARVPVATVATTSPVIPIDRTAEREAERAAYRVLSVNF